MPRTPISGVRTSWLTFAKNIDLKRVASSSFWLRSSNSQFFSVSSR
jgi:hypothetical protein